MEGRGGGEGRIEEREGERVEMGEKEEGQI